MPEPTPNEMNLLRTLWRMGPSSVKDVYDTFRLDRPDITYATVLRLMQVMHTKGLLKRDDSQRAHVYAPKVDESEFQTSMLGDLIQRVFASSGKDLVLTALTRHVSDKELKEIKDFLRDQGDA